MEQDEKKRLSDLLDERTMALMERESDLADRMEEIEAQKEELTAAVEELSRQNIKLEYALDELRERNRELDQILYRASHDLRSPITSIVGILNVLEYEPLTDLQVKCFAHIRDRSLQMDELLGSLSILAKTISNDVHLSAVNLDQLIRSCIGDLRFHSNFSNVVIRTDSGVQAEVTTDRLLMSIVLKNLLANALTFRDPQKEGLIQIRTHATELHFVMEIQDDGEGISELVKDQIFEMFYRGSERSTGSGLGLYIVRKVMNHLKGSVDFRCAGGITTFCVTLPIP